MIIRPYIVVNDYIFRQDQKAISYRRTIDFTWRSSIFQIFKLPAFFNSVVVDVHAVPANTLFVLNWKL